jgi:hypothetical protein
MTPDEGGANRWDRQNSTLVSNVLTVKHCGNPTLDDPGQIFGYRNPRIQRWVCSSPSSTSTISDPDFSYQRGQWEATWASPMYVQSIFLSGVRSSKWGHPSSARQTTLQSLSIWLRLLPQNFSEHLIQHSWVLGGRSGPRSRSLFCVRFHHNLFIGTSAIKPWPIFC